VLHGARHLRDPTASTFAFAGVRKTWTRTRGRCDRGGVRARTCADRRTRPNPRGSARPSGSPRLSACQRRSRLGGAAPRSCRQVRGPRRRCRGRNLAAPSPPSPGARASPAGPGLRPRVPRRRLRRWRRLRRRRRPTGPRRALTIIHAQPSGLRHAARRGPGAGPHGGCRGGRAAELDRLEVLGSCGGDRADHLAGPLLRHVAWAGDEEAPARALFSRHLRVSAEVVARARGGRAASRHAVHTPHRVPAAGDTQRVLLAVGRQPRYCAAAAGAARTHPAHQRGRPAAVKRSPSGRAQRAAQRCA
jgi:hypothetical protein